VENNENKTATNKQGLPEAVIQIMAWIALFGMFAVDKMLHMITPPLQDVWYGVAAGVAIFGHGAGRLMLKIRGNTP
jgi:hypothetical protein